MLKRLFVVGAAIASAGAAYGIGRARLQFGRWGIDPVEAGKPLPGDDIVPEADAVDTRGIDIAAPPEKVWPWLVQMGYGRAGWYSYDQLDMNHPSAGTILPELQQLEVGDVLPTHPGGGFEVRVVEPERALVLYADRKLVEGQAKAAGEAGEGIENATVNVQATGMYLDAAMRGDFRASWAFVLEPRPDGRTRLIERFRGWMPAPESGEEHAEAARIGKAVASRALLFGLFVMVRRQMLGIRDRAEGRPLAALPWGRILRTAAVGPSPRPAGAVVADPSPA